MVTLMSFNTNNIKIIFQCHNFLYWNSRIVKMGEEGKFVKNNI